MYPKLDANPNFSQIEEEIQKYWQENNIFQASISQANSESEYVFFDGPPFANGLPHYGHLLTGYVKDIVARYQTMLGNKVERRFGWDCHGLPAEMGAEKELGISGRHQIHQYGIAKFNEHCRNSVLKYTNEWKAYVTRQGRWVDFINDYKTMDKDYMESILWAFKRLYEKGLIYEAKRVLPYSWACETPLSNFETRMDNSYRQRTDKAVTVKFRLKQKPKSIQTKTCYLLAWTTTPWTLPSNLALAVNPGLDYVCVVKDEEESFILGAFALSKYQAEMPQDSHIIIKGKELEGLTYEPIFNYFSEHANSFRVLTADFVEEGEGTGVVHMAPAFGEEDLLICKANDIELVCPVDESGKFSSEIPDFKGRLVLDCNDDIIKKLKHQNNWLKTEQYLHNYPHCWRTDTPLIYRAVSSWYVKVTDFAERMVELNKQINWTPTHIRDGLFGKWLANAKDWSISRNRFWGTPIPVWRSDDPHYPRVDVYGSIAELEKDFGVKIIDLHRPFIDELVRPNPDDPTGKSMMRRVPDVFDCWFESGAMPFAQIHYPFENQEWFEKYGVADFIVEYIAQTRGWFYTLFVLSTALFDQVAFKNCIAHGVILDTQGQKLSKRLNNYADPMTLFDNYGSDALRFVMASSVVMRGEELMIDKDGNMVREAIRLVLKPVWNAYNFFVMYANIDEVKAKVDSNSNNLMDRYILAKLKDTIILFKRYMDNYDLVGASKLIISFFDTLNNWYIRRSRSRFWKSEKDQDKISAYDTLYTNLHLICRMIAPILPYLAEEIYLGLENEGAKSGGISVHLTSYPDVNFIADEIQLCQLMDKVRDVCSTALSIRNKYNLRSRLPLRSMRIIGHNYKEIVEYVDIIKDEVNVKEVLFIEELEDHAEFRLNINFAMLGKRLPQHVKSVVAASKIKAWKKLANDNIAIAEVELLPEEYNILLEAKAKGGSAPVASNDAIILLDIELDEDLINEGIARDLIRLIQQMRKSADFEIVQHIKCIIDCTREFQHIIEPYMAYIQEQTLTNIRFEQHIDAESSSIENHNLRIKMNE